MAAAHPVPSPPPWPRCLPRRAGCQQRGQWPLQGRLHHAPLRATGQPCACGAAGKVPEACTCRKCRRLPTTRPGRTLRPSSRCCKAMVGAALHAAGALYAAEPAFFAPQAWVDGAWAVRRAAGVADGSGNPSRPGQPARRHRCWRARCCRAWSMPTAMPSSAPLPA
jgi:hypothetical protein